MPISAESREVDSQSKSRVKLYGLLEMTKPAYLTMQTVVFLILIVLFGGSFAVEQLFGWSDHWQILWGFRAFTGLIILAEAVETLVICRKFKSLAAAQTKRTPPPLKRH